MSKPNITGQDPVSIDDYIEPQLIIKAKISEIETLTRNKDFAKAFKVNEELQAESLKLGNWLWKNMIAKEVMSCNILMKSKKQRK